MLEKQLSVLLATYLNRFICDLNEEQLRVSLWSGELVLRDLELRTNIVDQIALSLFKGRQEVGSREEAEDGDAARAAAQALMTPFTVVKGVVKELKIRVPWSAVDREPISVEVIGVEIVFGLLRARPHNAEEDAARVMVVKQKQLNMFEIGRLGSRPDEGYGVGRGVPPKLSTGAGSTKKLSYVEQLTETIKRNVHVVLRDVSLKYVVDYHGLAPCFTCALHVTLDSVYVTTTDEGWEDRFIMDLSMRYSKKVVMGGLRVSLHAVKQQHSAEGENQNNEMPNWQKKMNIVKAEELTVLLRLSKDSDDEDVVMDDVKQTVIYVIATTPIQLQISFGVVGFFAIINDSIRNGLVGLNYRQHLHLLNKGNEGALTWPQRRWKFALFSVMDDVRRSKNKAKGHQRFIEGVVLFGRRRREYCALWKRSQRVAWLPPLTQEETSNLHALEELLTVEQLVFLRCLAYAELSTERQSLWRQKLLIEEVRKRKQVGNEDIGSGGSRWWQWLGRRQAIGSSAALDEAREHKFVAGGGIEAEWAFGHKFLQHIATRRVGTSLTTSSSAVATTTKSTMTSTNSILIVVRFPIVDLEIEPDIWRSDMTEKKPLLSYLANLQQRLKFCFNSVKCNYTIGAAPQGDRAGFSLAIENVSGSFTGSLPSVVLETHNTHEEKKESEEDSGGQNVCVCEPWMSIYVNETHTRVSGFIANTSLTLQPLCELQWWVSGVKEFLAVLPEYTKQDFSSFCESTKSRCLSPSLPTMEIHVAGIILTMPLYVEGDTERKLILRAPDVHIITLYEEEEGEEEAERQNEQQLPMQEPALTMNWRFSMSRKEPICISCEDIGDVVLLSFAEVEVVFGRQLSVFVKTRAKATLVPTVLGLLHDHMECLEVAQGDVGEALFCEVMNNNGKWRLESSTALNVGGTVMTIPAAQCRRFLRLLYRSAATLDADHKKRMAPPAVNATLPLLHRVFLGIDFAHLTLRNSNNDDVVEIELSGVESSTYEAGPLIPSSFSQDAFVLDMTSSGTKGYDILLCLPDLHVTSPSGQHVLVLEGLTATYSVSSPLLSLEAGVLDVRICPSLVDCMEVLMLSSALLQPPTSSALVRLPGLEEVAGVTVVLSDATAHTERVMETALKRLNVRIQFQWTEECVAVHLNDLLLRASSASGGKTLNLRGTLDRAEYITDNGEEVKSFVLLAPSTGLKKNVDATFFTCTLESRTDGGAGAGRSFVSFQTRGGSVGVFYAYWMRLLSMQDDPAVVRLLNLFGSDKRERGCSSAREEMPQKSTPASVAQDASGVIIISGEVSALELLLATDAAEEVDLLNEETYIPFFVGTLTFRAEVSGGTEGRGDGCQAASAPPSLFRGQLTLSNMTYLSHSEGKGVWSPLITQASLLLENYTQLVPNAETNGYEYVKGGSGEMALHLLIGSSDYNGDTDVAMDVKLTLPWLNTLLRALSSNLLNAFPLANGVQGNDVTVLTPVTETMVSTKVPSSSPTSLSFLVTVSSVCLVLMKEPDIFALRAQLQFYSFNGVWGFGGEKTSVQLFHINKLTIDDISPNRRIMRHDIPKWQQQQRGITRESCMGREKRMLEVESGCISTPKPQTNMESTTLSRKTDLVFDEVHVYTARSSWTTLVGMLLFDLSAGAWTAAKNDAPKVNSDVAANSSLLALTVHQLNVHLELPWEEPLAQLSACSVRMQLHRCDGKETLEFRSDEPISLTPRFEHAAEVNILDWGDTRKEAVQSSAPRPFLHILVTQSQNNQRKYEFDTLYEEKPQVSCSNRVEVVLQSMKLIADMNFITRLSRFALDEVDAYSSLLQASKPLRVMPSMSLTMMDISVKDFQVLLPTMEAVQAPRWRLTVEEVKLTNKCVEVTLDSNSPAERGSRNCFANAYTMNLCGVFLLCEGLYPLRFPNTVACAQLPMPQSTFTEWRSTRSVTPDDCVQTHSTFVIVSPASLNDAQLRVSFCRRIHIQMEEGACLSISALHVRDALRVLPPRASSEEVPPYYATPVEVPHVSVCVTSFALVNMPRFSILLTENGHVKAEANVGNGGEKGVNEADLTTANLAKLCFLGTVTLSASFDSCEETVTQVQFAIHGSFELLDGNGVVVLFRRGDENLNEGKQLPSCRFPEHYDAGLCVDVTDSPTERRMCLESHGIIVTLQPHTVDFVLRMHNFIALMHREGFFAMERKNNANKRRINDADDTDVTQLSFSSTKRQTVLTIHVALLSLTVERTALMEARNVNARLSWRDGDSTLVDASIPYKVTIGDLVLRNMDSTYAFMFLSSLEVSLGVGEVNLRANPLVINNYDMLFYADLWRSVEALYHYVLQNVTFSKKNEDGFKQSVMVTLTDVRVCFFLSRQPLVCEATDGRMEIVFPVVVLKQKASTTGRSLTFETENGVIRYRRPEGLLPPFVKNLSLSCFVENSLVTQSRSNVIRLSGIEAFIPFGDTLQCCVEAVAQAFLPLLSVSAMTRRNLDVGPPSTAEVPATPLSCDKFVFTVPLVSLNVCASQSEDEALVGKAAVLFGVTFHNIICEQSRTGVNEKTLIQALSVTSSVSAAFQKEFVSATAPSGALDEPSKWAVYFCKEISVSEATVPSSLSHTDGGGGGEDSLHEQLPTRLVSIIARAHAVKLTVSPKLLSTLNEHFLLHVWSGVYRTRSVTASCFSSLSVRDAGASLHCSSVDGTSDQLLTIKSDCCLSSDLTLGGRRGTLLRFSKEPGESNPSNKITVKGVNHAKVFVSMVVGPDGTLKPPIVVDPGLTVVIEGVPFVTEDGDVMDYVELGARSLLVVPTELLPVAVPGSPCRSLATSANVSLNAARWYSLEVTIDALTDVALSLWSEHQSIEVSSEAYVRYKLAKNCYEGNRGVRDFIDESGEVALLNVSILCDSGFITKDPTGLMVHVKHHKLKEDHTNAGMTVVRAIVSNTSFTLSVGNLRLLYDTVNELRQGLNQIGSTKAMVTTLTPTHHRGEEQNRRFVTRGKVCTGGVDHSSHAEAPLLWSRDGEVTPLIDFAASAAWIEVILTSDFYRPEVAVALSNSALMAKGNRSLNRMKWTASSMVRVTDYPQLQPPRDVLLVSPEVAVEYTRHTGGGFSLQGALTCLELSLTLPLVTVLRLLRFRFDLQRTGAYSFLNCTGVPLLLLAVTKVNKKGLKPRTQFCRLPPGKLVKARLFHYSQTLFRVVADDREQIEEYDENLNMFGTEVNLSALRRGATYRFPLTEPSVGVLDVVMRLDEMERIVNLTTSVAIRNELSTHIVCLPGTPSDSCRVQPKETRYAPLPCLRHPFSLIVGEWRFKSKNALVTLEGLISAFTLFSSGQKGLSADAMKSVVVVASRRAYMQGDDTLVIPLTLEKEHLDERLAETDEKHREEMRVFLVLTRRVALESEPRTSRLLSRYEVELRVCPMVTVVNETGAVLAVNVVSSSSSSSASDAATHTRTFVREEEEFNCFSKSLEGESFSMNLTCEFADGVQFSSVEPLPLTFTGTTTVAIKDSVGEKMVTLLVEHAIHSKFIVRAAAILINALPFPVRVYDESDALVPGQNDVEGLPSGHKLPLTLPALREQLRRPDAAVVVKIVAGGPNATCSQLFTCNVLTVSGMLQSVDGDVVRIFRVQRVGGIKKVFSPTPMIRLEPMWVFRNQSHAFFLTVRSVGMTETLIIEPRTTKEWTTFAVASASDPLMQIRYGGNEEELFMWSEPLKLATLSGANVPITVRHQLYEKVTEMEEMVLPPSVVGAGVAVYTSMRTPMMVGESLKCERFACLSITPWRKNGIFYVDFSLDGNVPVVVENRTGRSLQYEHVRKMSSALQQVARAYVIPPFTDGVTCFDSDGTAHVMRLTLFGGDRPPQQCIVDLAKAAVTREAVTASPGMFVLCTYDHSIRRYYISVTADRSLESRLLFQPRYVIHVETFIHTLSLYVASICVPKDEPVVQTSPLAVLVTRNQLRLGRGITNEAFTNAEVLAALKRCELDVILIQALGIYGVFSANEKHYFGRLDIGRLTFIDCTNPRPAYPVIVDLNSEVTRVSVSDTKAVKPCLSVKMHALAPGDSTASTMSHAPGKDVTILLQHLSLDVAPVTVKLTDSLLFVLRQVGVCVWEAVQQTVPTRTVQEQDVGDGNEVSSPTSPSTIEVIPIYNCFIAHLHVSRIDLDLTLTRRSDGKFDPFVGIPLGRRFIPSVERAPLSISGVDRMDVSQRGSSPCGALLELLWPSYRNQLLFQFYKIIGSLEILGNPLALISGLRKGVQSFVVEVADMNPAKGARELLLATTSSTLHTVGLLSRVGSRTAATLSWDNDWLETREEDERSNDTLNRSGVLWGMAQGLRDGIEGVVARPLSGARTAGLSGFCTGIAAGAVGLLTRPIAGVLDGFGNTAEFYSKLLQAQDAIPNAHLNYLQSERNFVAAVVANLNKEIPAADTSATDSVTNSVSVAPASTSTGLTAAFGKCLAYLGSSKKWTTDSCEFVSQVAYESIRLHAKLEGLQGEEFTRFIKDAAGVHNYALYADWDSFVAHTTPEEFYNWVHIALAAALGKEMKSFLLSGEFSESTSTRLKVLPFCEPFFSTQQRHEAAAALERAEVIKNTLGVRDLLKYVSLEHMVMVCSLDEIKHHVSPESIHGKLPQLILATARESLRFIFFGGIEEQLLV
ncbi:vacuolar protein sorting-associated protein 13 family protein [Trypanosoma rangeli]|uniref:Vacuolar protein sorting-associated protein 13 family protein n=1 Tax=Trypanosoma rangeli TaxID=5698 RepID=A0A422NI48_TRYRA|nr:vacuolar protein sorting-associated protein 13 family protein [Trypanosoma rangeli]RNF05152.1 vacuolar protein sorting-associated protein 13 family protein [Trypanosoma rangeli]|eukprot:RNF05152.1 vacuolar protein sorting-associated protein 13 family protein [Trypanosoma rangeli]